MNTLDTTAARVGTTVLTLGDFLAHLRQTRQLLPLLRAALTDKVLISAARSAGLAVTSADLQKCANRFRSNQGLHSATATYEWLAQQGLSAADLEESLERELLVTMLRDHLTAGRIEAEFEANPDRFAVARVHLMVVPREDIASELLTQLEEGGDFASLAAVHSVHPSRTVGGNIGLVRRQSLTPLAAEAVFTASPGKVVGPLAAPDGFHLFLVEEVLPAQLDDATRGLLREEIFSGWLQAQLLALPEFPLLGESPTLAETPPT